MPLDYIDYDALEEQLLAGARFKVGDRVLYRGCWGAFPEEPATITGIGTKNGRRVYDLDNNHWGYEDQLTKARS